jgi:hypothetical protein
MVPERGFLSHSLFAVLSQNAPITAFRSRDLGGMRIGLSNCADLFRE